MEIKRNKTWKTDKEGPTYILSESLKKSKQKEIILIFKNIIKFPKIKDVCIVSGKTVLE